MAGVQDIIDVIDLMEEIASSYEAAKADGTVSIFDIPKFAGVFPALQAAVSGADQIPEQIKDMDADEVKLVIQRLLMALDSISKSIGGGEIPQPVAEVISKGLDLVTCILKAWVLKK